MNPLFFLNNQTRNTCILCAAFFVAISIGQQNITVNIQKQYQTVHGFGGSDAWNCHFVGKYWSEPVKEEIAEKLFSKEVDSEGNPKGIGLSRWRFNMGAGSAEQGNSSNIIDVERRAELFLNENGTYDWGKQSGQQWFLRKAVEYKVETLVAFLNSPPRYYTKNGRANSDNPSRGGSTNLKADHYPQFVDFITTVLKHFSDTGINFSQISPVNEPQYEWKEGQEGCPWQNLEIKNLAVKLDSSIREKKLDTKILLAEAASFNDLHEVNGSSQTSDQIWRFFNSENAEYIGELKQLLPGIAAHSYWTDNTDATITSTRQNIKREAEEQGNIELYQTEYNLLSQNYDSKIINTLFLAKMIYADLVIAGVSIWDYWTVIDRERWSQLNRFFLIKLNPIGGDYGEINVGGSISVDKNLWALGNYSRFIRPNYRRVEVSGASDLSSLMASGFISPDTSKLIVVYVNWSKENKLIKQAFSAASKIDSLTPYITNATYNLSKQATIKATSNYTIPAQSIVTMVADINNPPPTSLKDNEKRINNHKPNSRPWYNALGQPDIYKDQIRKVYKAQ